MYILRGINTCMIENLVVMISVGLNCHMYTCPMLVKSD